MFGAPSLRFLAESVAGLIPLAVLALVALLLFSRKKSPSLSRAILEASVLWGVGIWGASEILGQFGALKRGVLASLWTFVLLAVLVRIVVRRKDVCAALRRLRPPIWTAVLAPVLLATLATAILYPPNTPDALIYHLPRIEFWLRQGSLSFYPACVQRQLFSQPFAEIALLHIHTLSGSDVFDGLLQWSANLGCIILCRGLAVRLSGGVRRAGTVAAILAATLPIAVAESSTCQNDLVEAFWILATLQALADAIGSTTVANAMLLGGSAGLAVLTKGSAYPFLAPAGILFAAFCIRRPLCRMLPAAVAAAVIVAVNAPHWTRTAIRFGDPLGGQSASFRPPATPSAFAVTVWSDFASNVHPLFPAATRRATMVLLRALNIDLEDDRVFWRGTTPLRLPGNWFHQDTAPNPIHSILLLLALPCVVALRRRMSRDAIAFAALLATSWVAFALCIRWQPWITRIQTPLLMEGMVLCGVLFGSFRGRVAGEARVVLCALACIAALPWAWCSEIRSLLPCPWQNPCNLRVSAREELYFPMFRGHHKFLRRAAEEIVGRGARSVGVTGGEDNLEYPLFPMLRHRAGKRMPDVFPVEDADRGTVDVVIRIGTARDSPRLLDFSPEARSNGLDPGR